MVPSRKHEASLAFSKSRKPRSTHADPQSVGKTLYRETLKTSAQFSTSKVPISSSPPNRTSHLENSRKSKSTSFVSFLISLYPHNHHTRQSLPGCQHRNHVKGCYLGTCCPCCALIWSESCGPGSRGSGRENRYQGCSARPCNIGLT